jgi:hypothetical protein
MNYSKIVQAIKEECGKINLSFSAKGDGRLASAIKETEYLDLLEKGLTTRNPPLVFAHQPVARWWWDLRVNGLTMNLKLTTGGTDNAFNKSAIIYTISGEEPEKKNMNYNLFFQTLKLCKKKVVRDPMTEYHYLVVNKDNGSVLLKSILDIHSFKSNPCNDLQINWTSEFNHADHFTPDAEFKGKVRELLKTVQTSVTQAIAGMKDFAEADIDKEFA